MAKYGKRKRNYYKRCFYMDAYQFMPTGAIQPTRHHILYKIYKSSKPLDGAVITDEECQVEYNDTNYRIIKQANLKTKESE